MVDRERLPPRRGLAQLRFSSFATSISSWIVTIPRLRDRGRRDARAYPVLGLYPAVGNALRRGEEVNLHFAKAALVSQAPPPGFYMRIDSDMEFGLLRATKLCES